MSDLKDKIKDDALRYALETRRAYHFWGRAMRLEDAETESCLSLHEWACNPKNTKDFLGMVAKAEEFLQKYSAPEDDQELVAKERKTITELQEHLAAAVVESQFIS